MLPPRLAKERSQINAVAVQQQQAPVAAIAVCQQQALVGQRQDRLDPRAGSRQAGHLDHAASPRLQLVDGPSVETPNLITVYRILFTCRPRPLSRSLAVD